jgi:hypothetical protein
MKPTQHEKELLRDYLYKVLKYRETFEEIYDHTLMALENKTRHQFFETTLVEVLDGEFGGINGLVEIEKNCKEATIKDAVKHKQTYWSEFLTISGIIFVISLFTGIFYMARIKFFEPILLLSIILFPIVMLATRGFRAGFIFDNNKESTRDGFFRKMAYGPLKLVFICSVLNGFLAGITKISNFIAFKLYSLFNVYFMITHYLDLIILLIGILHIIVFVKLYRDEFKNRLVPSKNKI